ncbi:hypothetical protein DAEQUDRAFT_516894 [Daedalea quercina L-15889]|uniref:Uncharacterized protein n=1 Tax=Daedalea quercina L-15889 TaxID=1314783 RepID=A0A165MG09_9APHY|nr:hypothetical protein DAEQUDRAFT_516894 [Daedalea quercina L-15889]
MRNHRYDRPVDVLSLAVESTIGDHPTRVMFWLLKPSTLAFIQSLQQYFHVFRPRKSIVPDRPWFVFTDAFL